MPRPGISPALDGAGGGHGHTDARRVRPRLHDQPTIDGRLFAFPLEALNPQRNGGGGLTLMDVDAQPPLGSVATFADTLNVAGLGGGDKPKDEDLKGAALAVRSGGTRSKGWKKVLRVLG